MSGKIGKHGQSLVKTSGAVISRFCGERKGGVGPMFGLTFSIMLMFVAAAVDLSRWAAARSDTKSAVDAAVLAGARSLQVENENIGAAIAASTRYYTENTKNLRVVDDSIHFETAANNMAMQAKGQSYVQTPFLNLVGIPRMPLVKDVEGLEGAIAEASVAAGGNGEGEVEISMMLDITGSMGGSKIADLKDAAKDLVDIVLLKENGKSRIALAPFSEAVRLDSDLASLVITSGPSSVTSGRTRYDRDANCATERTGTQRFTDAAPVGSNKVGDFYDRGGQCVPTSGKVIPLSYNKSMLKSAINNFQASGNTAGHLGTAWAWYLLSPNWASVLPSASTPGAYGEDKLRKIAILMTDGEYNTQYQSSGISGSSPNGSSTSQARELCTNMKAAGITVYTVGFQLSQYGASRETLRQCATDDSKFFSAENGDALRQAFRDIALQISTLYLTR